MNTLLSLLNVNTTFFTILGYPMSYIEFFGTLLNLWTVWLVAKKKILNWPVGIVATLLFGALFYQLHLYADFFEQIYYFITGFIGWYVWAKTKPTDMTDEIVVKTNGKKTNLLWIGGILTLSALGAWAMAHVHLWLPSLFPVPASLPFLDTLTTVMSFAATILMINKKLENWVLWIIVDVIGVWLYWYKGVPFVALLYACFLCIATKGFLEWKRTLERSNHHETGTSDR